MQTHSSSTISKARAQIENLIVFLERECGHSGSPEEILCAITEEEADALIKKNIESRRVFQELYRWLLMRGKIKRCPAAFEQHYKTPISALRELSPELVEKLRGLRGLPIQDRIAIEFLLLGLTPTELVTFVWERVDLESQSISVVSRGRHRCRKAVPQTLVDMLQKHFAQSPGELVFMSRHGRTTITSWERKVSIWLERIGYKRTVVRTPYKRGQGIWSGKVHPRLASV